MRTKTGPSGSADKHVKEIKRKARRQFSAEEKIRIVLDGLRGEESSIAELCRREGISRVYTRWHVQVVKAYPFFEFGFEIGVAFVTLKLIEFLPVRSV